MNQYKKLAQNTLIFAIGTFSSKVLSFFMVYFYSHAMETAEFGVLDILVNSGALLLPVAMLGITNGIIRFGLDPDYRKSDVLTTGLLSLGLGFGGILICCPLIALVPDLRPYLWYLYAHVLMSSLRHIASFFVRADNKPLLFAADGVFSTFMTCALTIVFLLPLSMGIRGYLLAIIIADFLSVIFLSVGDRIWRNLRPGELDPAVTRQMLRFSIPLIPTTLLWWIINVSDRFFVKFLIGADANGLYAAAYKVPTVLTLVSSVFLDAWQISAVSENKSEERNSFFTAVFRSFMGAIFAVSSVLIFTAKWITQILLAPSYFDSWRYIPVLIAATVFSCFVVFMGNIYMAEKRSVSTLVTTLAGAALNIVLNAVLIPRFGPQGAAIATFASYFLIFLIRAIDIHRRNPAIRFSPVLLSINSLLLAGQVITMLLEGRLWILWQALFVLAFCLINLPSLLSVAKKLLKRGK